MIIRVYTQPQSGQAWLEGYRHSQPGLVCVLGFTQTGLIAGISAAGATPKDRCYTAIADGEFLLNGPTPNPSYPLPPLEVGASPVLISRAVTAGLEWPTYLFNAGLPQPPAVPAIDLGGVAANCVSTGQAMTMAIVEHLFQQGINWGEKLAQIHPYLILGECVVGGTTTALAVLTGLGYRADKRVNSSHPICNHAQKWQIVQQGLQAAAALDLTEPLQLAAAIGDPMQVVVAGMAIAASRRAGVLLAGGTQMLAVYALARAIALARDLFWQPAAIVVGTTRWVAEDPTADAVGLAAMIGDVPLLATQLSFATARYSQLQAYEQGYVKEGVAAGGCAISATLHQNWGQTELLAAIEEICDRQISVSHFCPSALGS
ncbi:MAG: TIGR00303 family protein [Aphanocapsa sp. GSE-SYN-MK-11-07L]|jgi:uncharacterized protein (TIGR00303 family)|nr:TIGR00303 family protein [Aphanocapsa sp. GSE-SYN-MK-11-07L]